MFHRLHLLQTSAAFLVMLAFFVSLGNFVANAQTAGAGSISGTIMDPSKSALPGALVTVTNVDTGIEHQYTTNSSGLYVAPFLQPGHYKITATSAGFGRVEASNITLLVGQTVTIDLNM